MSVAAFLNCCKNKYVRFAEPSTWTDKFEKRFYMADYITNLHAAPDTHPRLFAFCNTLEKDCEPSWTMYTNSCCETIQLKIRRSKWLFALNSYANKKSVEVYEGIVNYDVKESHLAILHHTQYCQGNKMQKLVGHDQLFKSFDLDSYMSLLLFKRSAYKYENEIRYFVIQQNADEDYLFIPIDWLDMI